MDRPLDDLIKEIQGEARKNYKQNKGFSKMKGSKGSGGAGGRQERRQKQEPYSHKVVFQPQPVNFQEAPKLKKEPVLTFSVKNTQVPQQQLNQPKVFTQVPQQQLNQPKVFTVSQTSHAHAVQPPQAAVLPSTGQKLSIFERIGAPKPKPASAVASTSGTSVTISNINNDVTLADLSELCGAIGEVLGVSFVITGSKTKKQANVIFARRSDAITFVQKFHNLPLDGVPLSVCLTGENGKENPFNPFPINAPGIIVESDSGVSKNVRSGLFGTHLGASAATDDEYEGNDMYEDEINYGAPVHDSGNQQRFSVTMKGSGTGSGFGGQRQPPQQQQQPHQNRVDNRGDYNRNKSGGREGGNFQVNHNKRGGGSTKATPVSENDLDNALASYMATR